MSPAARETAAVRFAVAIMLVSLLLQRFAIPVSGLPMSVVGPIGLGLAAVALLRGVLVLDRLRLCLYLAFVAFVLAGAAANASGPPRFGVAQSLPSIMHFLGLTGFAVFGFAQPVDEARLFRALTACLALVAVAGLAQFAFQFAGFDVFEFAGLVPDQLLIEHLYILRIPIGETGLFKSNGFFLLEPSIMSQMMVLGLIMEILWFRRPAMLALFAAALVAALSGTGWLMLGGFVVAAVLGLGARGVLLGLGTALAAGAALGAMALALPAAFESFIGRLGEFSTMGTSGHLRFVTPFWVLQYATDRAPLALWLGIGAGVSEDLPVIFHYSLNTPVKLALEFGVPVLALYLALFLAARRTPRQAALVVPCLVQGMLAGAYQQLAPVLFPLWLVMTVALVAPAGPRAAPARGETAPRAASPRPAGGWASGWARG
jgi:hypothetical protein